MERIKEDCIKCGHEGWLHFRNSPLKEDTGFYVECEKCSNCTDLHSDKFNANKEWNEKNNSIVVVLITAIKSVISQRDEFKEYHDIFSKLPSCNDCGDSKDCPLRPKCGEPVRINCIIWRKERHINE